MVACACVYEQQRACYSLPIKFEYILYYVCCAFKFLKFFASLRFEFWREIGEKEKRRERDAFRAENDGVDSIDVVVTE